MQGRRAKTDRPMRDGRARCLTAPPPPRRHEGGWHQIAACARGRERHDPPPVGTTGRGRGRLHVIDPAHVVTAAPLHATTRVAKECPAPSGATIHAKPLGLPPPPGPNDIAGHSSAC